MFLSEKSLLDAALFYRSLGIPIVPVIYNEETKKRKPLIKWSETILSHEQIIDIFKQQTDINMILGRCDNLMVIDVDTHGDESPCDIINKLASMCNVSFTDLVCTDVANTKSGGMHLYFRLPKNFYECYPDLNRQMQLRDYSCKLDIDILCGKKCAITLPPSLNNRYNWYDCTLPEGREVAPCFLNWLQKQADTKEKQKLVLSKKKTRVFSFLDKGAFKDRQSIEKYIFTVRQNLKPISEGNRNSEFFSFCAGLLKKIPPEDVWSLTQERNDICSKPLPLDELTNIFLSAQKYEGDN